MGSMNQAPKRQYNKQNSMLKKQQKLLMLQQQQQEQMEKQQQLEQQQQLQLQQQLAQSPLALVAAASQFANFFEQQQQQQLLLALQQQLLQPNAPLSAGIFQQQQQNNPFANNLFKQLSTPTGASPQQSTAMSSSASTSQHKRKPSSQNTSQCDYLIKPHKKVDRRHADPLVSLAILLEGVLNELRDLPEASAFLQPVNAKKVPDYHKLIEKPVDFGTIRKRIHEKAYKKRDEFADDIKLLVENSQLYNGPNHVITSAAQNVYSLCLLRLEERNDQLTKLEKAINPLLDDNSLIAFNYLLDQIYEQFILTVENSFSFLKPVNKAKYKDYYEIIKTPIDLETIKQVGLISLRGELAKFENIS
jgi:hypothetical protein